MLKKLFLTAFILIIGIEADAQINRRNQTQKPAKHTRANTQKQFTAKVQQRTYQEIQPARIPKNQSDELKNKFTGRIEKAFKNDEDIYGVIVVNDTDNRAVGRLQKRAVGRLQRQYKSSGNKKVEIDPNRMVVFFDEENNWLDESSFPGDMFSPKDLYIPGDKRNKRQFPGDMFLPGSGLFKR